MDPTTLAQLEPRRPFALFLRHAARHDVPAHDPYADVDLTEAGVSAARALATSLDGAISHVLVSPFLRCRRTGALVAGDAAPLVDDQRLGAHGPWVTDPDAGARLFSRLGLDGVVRAQIAGAACDGLRPLSEGSRLLLSCALDAWPATGSVLCVSHDAVLMPAIAHLTGHRFDGAWLAPLDGFVVVRGLSGFDVLWRGERHAVSC